MIYISVSDFFQSTSVLHFKCCSYFLLIFFPSICLPPDFWRLQLEQDSLILITVVPSSIETGAICHALTNEFGFPPSKLVVAFNIHDL